MRIHFLGTSAGVPTLRRGLPAVAVEREGDLLLFDCGEGTQMALQRSEAKASRLVAVFLSHMHGDHVLGLPGLLLSLQMGDRPEPLTLVGPPGLREFVTGALRSVQARLQYELDFRERSTEGVTFSAEEYDVACDRVDHRAVTLGYALLERNRPGRFDVEAARALAIPEGPLYGALQRGEPITLPDGRRIEASEVVGPPRRGRRVAYVTDTRPCPGALRLAHDADLLIHEATFEAGWEEEAASKGHSTVADACRAGIEAGAKALVLTHLSPRYEDVEPLRRQAREGFPADRGVWIAEDGMIVTLERDGAVVDVTEKKRRKRGAVKALPERITVRT